MLGWRPLPASYQSVNLLHPGLVVGGKDLPILTLALLMDPAQKAYRIAQCWI